MSSGNNLGLPEFVVPKHPHPFFWFTFMTRDSLAKELRSALGRAGIEAASYARDSFRIGQQQQRDAGLPHSTQ